jgi:hypothetical protein
MGIDVHPSVTNNAIGDFTVGAFGYSNLHMIGYIGTATKREHLDQR